MYHAQEHFAHLYQNATRQFAFRGESQEEWQAWHKAFYPRLMEALGLERMAAQMGGFIPHSESIDSEDMGDWTRERWQLWVEPTVPLPFILLRPKTATESALPLVLTPHGHSRNTELYAGNYENEEEYREMAEGERDVAVQAVREGYLAIAPTARGFGKTRTEDDQKQNVTSSCRTELLHDLLVGRTPIGVRCWDISRLIDWAFANLNVDQKRIAITGNSGGGTVSLFAAAVDERIGIAIPSCYFCTFAGSIGSIHHCDCNYIPGMLELGEMYDVAGLIAPRPFRAIAGKEDSIFPIEHVRLAFEKLLKIYRAAVGEERAEQLCQLFVGEGGHRYYKDGAWGYVRKWFRESKIDG